MKRTGITTKLFLATASIFVLFYVIVLVSQILVFPEFYEHQKMIQLEKNAVELTSIYQKDPTALRETGSSSILQSHKREMNFALTDFDGNMTVNDPYRMRLIQKDGTEVDVSLYYIVSAYGAEFKKLNLAVGTELKMYGEFGESSNSRTFYPYYIQTSDGKDVGVNEQQSSEDAVQGKIISISLPSVVKTEQRLGLLYVTVDEFFPLEKTYIDRLKRMEQVELKWKNPFSGSRSGILIQPLREQNGNIELLFLVTSLQEIKETNSALRLFYAYLGAGGFILILLLSVLYSRLVTRPLLMLNKQAHKMKELDFTGEKPLPRKDELGNLSGTLFELSGKLNITLDELNKANVQLKKEIIQNKQMEQLQKDFFANASHELKTPISIVRGFAEGIRDGISMGRQEHYVEVILEESAKMEQLVQDMLDLLRLESSAVKLYKSPVLLSELTQDMLEKLTYQMDEKELSAHLVYKQETEINVDPVKIEQVLLNLMTNAIRHAEKGSTIEIHILGTEQTCLYSIYNKGDQIPEDYLKRIWERFFRVEASRDRKSGGTGLGLAIVKRILELHECEYNVKNVEDGVIFELTFKKVLTK
ncbi:HAMP domain-containing sensor histidine kinase [Paenibacillus sp. PK4536]|uniref:sensor histidine kinase n=1 Tax=Paenibacillus sp. PK4536 TaxID=3024576 RepID=UPI002359C9F5|nr:HAMP domain-containing sensor histidine kinase [Paenibacillus sp. PK4536]WIM40277.1 HAMP domain-containing sensor histidine kinase [Paenibacillus sp. PK4536]